MDENTRRLAQFLLSDDARTRRQRQNLALAGYDTSGYQPTFGPSDSSPEQAGPEVGPMRRSPVNPIVAGPDQASFLTSEKDTRPHWETDQRSMLMPLVMSGYNNSVSYGVPSFFGGHAWSTMGDIVKGNAVHPDEIAHSANDAAGAAMLGSMPMWAPKGAIRSGAARTTPEAGRSLDSLGYYSAALEAAKSWPQGKGTPEQALTWLKKSGTKDAEIAATGLDQAIAGRPSVTRDELIAHLEGNKVGLKESQYATTKTRNPRYGEDGQPFWADATGAAKWKDYSIDPSNPTYKETVLHLPVKRRMSRDEYLAAYRKRFPQADTPDSEVRGWYERGIEIPGVGQTITQKPDVAFQSGHFPEPNIVGHMMTSVNKHEGKPVFTLDQIQSDWGQKLRDGGVRDEAKIAGLKQRVEEANKRYITLMNERDTPVVNPDGSRRNWNSEWTSAHAEQAKGLAAAKREYDLLNAELKTAEASSPGHPLVNTTDQWTNTTLRRALQQAIEQDAQHIAVPRGDTVLSYNPGDTHGMNTFYNEIVPKNLAKILERLDKAGVARRQVDQLETPSGMKGSGFTLFDITPKMREEARKGLPLFANPPTSALAALLLGQEPQE